METQNKTIIETATFGGGCFWCTEAIFKSLKGVKSVTPGYAGGTVANPTYQQVCAGTSGHAESIQVEFDPSIITYETLVEVFFGTHNPTMLNRQGNDVGTQYRSAIFFHSEQQKKTAKEIITQLENDKTFGDPIVTTLEPFTVFYPAENDHRDYFANNPNQPYCQAVITPKLAKFRQRFSKLLQ